MLYAITAKIRKSRTEGKPGVIIFCIRDKDMKERKITSGIQSTDEEFVTTNRNYVLNGLRHLYEIIQKSYKGDSIADIDFIASKFRNDIGGGFDDTEITGFYVDKRIVSIGSPFNKWIIAAHAENKKYQEGDKLGIGNLAGFIDFLMDSDTFSKRAGTQSNYRNTRTTLSEYIENLPENRTEIDLKFIEDFGKWLQKRGLSNSTISFYMRMLRAILNKAKAKGLIAVDENWFAGRIERFSSDGNGDNGKALSKSDINQIASVNLSGEPFMELSRDLFMFSFYCRGMELFDILNLTEDNIHGDLLVYNKRLTGKLQVVKIDPHAKMIIDKYLPESDGFIFSAVKKYSNSKEYNTLRCLIRPRLVELGKLLGIKVPMAFSTARYTWTTLSKESDLASMMLM